MNCFRIIVSLTLLTTAEGRGHVITAETLKNGKVIFYDPQSGDFLNIEEYNNLESIEILKVDKLIFKEEILIKISRLLQ